MTFGEVIECFCCFSCLIDFNSFGWLS